MADRTATIPVDARLPKILPAALAVASGLVLAAAPAFGQNRDAATPVATVDAEELEATPRGDVADALARQPAGPGGFYQSNDVLKFGERLTGSFELTPDSTREQVGTDVTAYAGVLFQPRTVLSYFDDGDDDIDLGTEITRAAPYVFGTIGPEEGMGFLTGPIGYRIQGNFNNTNGELELEDAFAILPVKDGIAVRFGQFRNPFSAEGTTFEGFNLAVDQSLASAVFAGGALVQGGSALIVLDDLPELRAEVAITDGLGSQNTSFRDVTGNLGIAGRGEYLIEGDWADFTDFSAVGTREQGILAGAGFDLTFAGDTTVLNTTVDFRLERPDGLAAYAAGFLNLGQVDGDSTFGLGATGQVSKVLDGGFEPFGRVSLLFDDEAPPMTEDVLIELTGGANYYFQPEILPHRVKLTADVGLLPLGAIGPAETNYVTSDDPQFVIRGQLQILL